MTGLIAVTCIVVFFIVFKLWPMGLMRLVAQTGVFLMTILFWVIIASLIFAILLSPQFYMAFGWTPFTLLDSTKHASYKRIISQMGRDSR
jgi:hypothetical protein